ncbi:hypothetical protein [Nonomuraea harbinensis]|uniref:Secreted protein n=1 Tax=Nonomuraea harbinensis TaxID=1286938 RepID=A0ABW1C2C6_9ACTN|nr:hypothetical protein [Nonomuraea harbinensis]
MRKTTWAAAIALTAGLLAGGAPSAATAASPTDNGVHNTSTIAVGAVQTWITNACVYRQGCYDALIPAGRYSGWRYTAAVYFGDNYCLRVRAWQAGGGLGPVTITGEGPAYFVFNSVHPGFDVRAVPINHADCHSAAATSSGDAGEVVQAGQ